MKNKHKSQRVGAKRGRGSENKTTVVDILQESGNVVNAMVENTSSATLGAFMVANVAKGYTLITDSYPAYRRANAGYNHVVVDHTKDIYVVDGSTTNGFEVTGHN
ncbi:MAG: transposase [Bacteroidetes bacterium]|nr:transposase [Bacteroidota bacterium]